MKVLTPAALDEGRRAGLLIGSWPIRSWANRRFMRCWLLACILCLQSCVNAAASEGLTAYRHALSCLKSFDVVVTGVTEFRMKTIPHQVEVGGRSVQQIKVVEYDPDEPRDKTTCVSRQIWEWTDRSRVEIGTGADRWVEKKVFDGETRQTLQLIKLQGVISGESIHQRPLIRDDNRYQCLYSEPFDGGAYSEIFTQRSFVETVRANGNVILDSPAQSSNLYPQFGFLLELSSKHGYLPVRIVVTRDNAPRSATTISRFKHITDDLWVPIEATHQFYVAQEALPGPRDDPPVFSSVFVSVDVERSHWNLPIDDKLFQLEFPQGSRVYDKIHGTVYIAGEADIGANLEAIYQKAEKLLEVDESGRAQRAKRGVKPRPAVTQSVLTFSCFVLVVVLAALCWRKVY